MEIIPPGIACTSTPASTASTREAEAGSRFAFNALKYALISARSERSSEQSNPTDSRMETMLSAGGCEENEDSVEMAQSTHPAPASTAARYIAAAMPLVMCECTCIGMSGIALTSAPTSSRAAPGVRMPAMSLMHSESTPIDLSSRASDTYFSTVCTGDVV